MEIRAQFDRNPDTTLPSTSPRQHRTQQSVRPAKPPRIFLSPEPDESSCGIKHSDRAKSSSLPGSLDTDSAEFGEEQNAEKNEKGVSRPVASVRPTPVPKSRTNLSRTQSSPLTPDDKDVGDQTTSRMEAILKKTGLPKEEDNPTTEGARAKRTPTDGTEDHDSWSEVNPLNQRSGSAEERTQSGYDKQDRLESMAAIPQSEIKMISQRLNAIQQSTKPIQEKTTETSKVGVMYACHKMSQYSSTALGSTCTMPKLSRYEVLFGSRKDSLGNVNYRNTCTIHIQNILVCAFDTTYSEYVLVMISTI